MFGPLNFPKSPSENTCVNPPKRTPCILCDDKFDLDLDREEFSNHILESHNVIIKDSDCIIDLSEYVNYWKDKFKSVSLKEVCCPVESQEPLSSNDTTPCYIISDSNKEDKGLRERINKKSLERALEYQKLEREDKQFKRRCLFCKLDIEPTRADYLNHLSSSHNLQLGKPDNLVFLDKYLGIIEDKIKNLKCIFCEKTFKDRNVLKEHMRKKLHKRVNPWNPIYDQFYMVNYLAPGLANKNLRERKRRKSFDDDEDDCAWSDWKEESTEPIVCLFCTDNFLSWDSVLQHLLKDHQFDFKAIASQLNFYEQVKIVNYIRRQVYRNQCIICDETASDRVELLSHFVKEKHFLKPPSEKWDQPEFFFPTYENDGFLYHLDDSSGHSGDSEEDRNEGDNVKSESLNFSPGMEKSLKCLFCNFIHKVGDVLMQHMYDDHEFDYNEYTRSLNFMERVKLVNFTRKQLENYTCIECDKRCLDMKTLLDHIKQDNHFHTPPKSVWDHNKFMSVHEQKEGKASNLHENTVDFLYTLEGIPNIKKELSIEKEEVKESCFSDCDEDEIPIVCLYCDTESSSWTQALSHLDKAHKFPFLDMTSQLSFYDQVKMVTYIRKMVKQFKCPFCEEPCKKQDFISHHESNNHFKVPPKALWDKSEYYPATFKGDPFLSELNVYHATDTLNSKNTSNEIIENQNEDKIVDDVNSNDSDWGDWDEEMKIPVACLLCKNISDNWVDVHDHMRSKHNFSFHEISSGLMFYDQVKLVNYIRSQVASKRCFVCDSEEESNEKLLEHCTKENHLNLPEKQLWNKDKFFQPFLENDGFLSHIDDGDSDDGI